MNFIYMNWTAWLRDKDLGYGRQIWGDLRGEKRTSSKTFKIYTISSAIEQFGNSEELLVEEVNGSLKACHERIWGQIEVNEGNLLLTEDHRIKREQTDGKLLLTRNEC